MVLDNARLVQYHTSEARHVELVQPVVVRDRDARLNVCAIAGVRHGNADAFSFLGGLLGHGQRGEDQDQLGYIEADTRAIFGRGYAAEPDVLIEQLRHDEAIAEADTLLLTVPNQLGVDYNAHVIEAILKHVAPGLGWR